MKILNQLLERLHSRSSTQTPATAEIQNPNVTKIIDDALASAGLGRGTVKGGHIAGVIDDALARAGLLGPERAHGSKPVTNDSAAPVARPPTNEGPETRASPQGQFLSRTLANPAGALTYKLYVPSSYDADASRTMPLLVMLHGCTQSPDDFAAGTRMNAQAELHGFLVAYPAQSSKANANKCWNWFRPQDQARGSGEPALIASMTAQIGADYRVDSARIYVAGLSAGAAMAVVLGRTYPEIFAAVGAHSGLPYRAAHDIPSAFSAMRSGSAGMTDATVLASGKFTPTIVFHGDRDQTVSATNGNAIVAHLTPARGAAPHTITRDDGTARGGHSYARTTHADASGRIVVEDWRVHGGGHAWMGGSAAGSYTDPQGPDASAEMVRFFLQHALSEK
ncbi:MAG: PHB depolymerase family esterase [Pseudomonadota bacterium]|nr:PHB depolymerase family esterase [Pseudomonadota bacterium]